MQRGSPKHTSPSKRTSVCRGKTPNVTGVSRKVTLYLCITWPMWDSSLGHLQAKRLPWSPDLSWGLYLAALFAEFEERSHSVNGSPIPLLGDSHRAWRVAGTTLLSLQSPLFLRPHYCPSSRGNSLRSLSISQLSWP